MGGASRPMTTKEGQQERAVGWFFLISAFPPPTNGASHGVLCSQQSEQSPFRWLCRLGALVGDGGEAMTEILALLFVDLP